MQQGVIIMFNWRNNINFSGMKYLQISIKVIFSMKLLGTSPSLSENLYKTAANTAFTPKYN